MDNSPMRQDLLERLEANRKRLLEIVAEMSEEQLVWPHKPGDRSPKGQLLHVAETELSYVERWARRARDEDRPDVGVDRQAARQASAEAPLYDEANALSLAELLSRLEKSRENTLKFLQETPDDQFPRVARNTPFGDMTVWQLLKSLYRHDEMHWDEILGRTSRYVVETADGRRL